VRWWGFEQGVLELEPLELLVLVLGFVTRLDGVVLGELVGG
jgi:hypothetical protein